MIFGPYPTLPSCGVFSRGFRQTEVQPHVKYSASTKPVKHKDRTRYQIQALSPKIFWASIARSICGTAIKVCGIH